MSELDENAMTLPMTGRRLAGAWFLLALAALGASALLAVVLVAARTPFLGIGSEWFRTALVLHVDLAVLVWFLAVAAGTWVLVRGHEGWYSWGAFWLAAVALVLMLASPLSGNTVPLLANYVPVLDNRLFLMALIAFFAAVLFTASVFLVQGWGRRLPLWGQAGRWSALVLLVAALVFVIDMLSGQGATRALTIEDRVWGAGHLLQFVHAVLLMGVWSVLGERLLLPARRLLAWLPALLAVTALSALGGVGISLLWEVGTPGHEQGFTELMRWASWPSAAIFGVGLLGLAIRRRRAGELLSGEEWVLLLSVVLFLGGCLVGATIRGNASTVVPAHYHGTVGAVTLAYLLVARRVALAFGLPLPSGFGIKHLPKIYGLGIAVLVIGLAWAGWLGVPRKAPHADLTQMGMGYLMAMGVAGVGGFVALTSIAAFVWVLLAAVWRGHKTGARQRTADTIYWPAILVVLGALGLTGLFGLNRGWFQSDVERLQAHVQDQQRMEVDQRFRQGVVMLQKKEYDHALTAFHRVLELAPEMPEAYVNAGFALLGKGEFAAAADFFDDATGLKRDQLNAYYGLAVALEGMGNLRAATEAMQTYLHRAPAEDPFRIKAEAAVWEWSEAIRNSAPALNVAASGKPQLAPQGKLEARP